MLRDKYEADPAFWALIKEQAFELEPELAVIDQVLADEALYQLIRADLSKNRPLTLVAGRHSTPVAVIIRMLAVKRLYGLSYAATERQVRDSLILRWFCRLYFRPVFDHSNLNKWALLIQPETLAAFNARLTELATALKVTRGRKLRTDGTVVETNSRYPSDSGLLADGVRVLNRVLKRAKAVVSETAELATTVFRDRRRSARQQARRIAETAGKRGQAARVRLKKQYQRLIRTAQASLAQVQQVLPDLQAQTTVHTQRLVQTLKTFIPRIEPVIDQTVQRVVHGQSVPAQDKLVSLFEPHTDIIRRQKLRKPTEFGHKVWLDEVDGGLISAYRILDGNPPDHEQWVPALDQHLKQFGHPPEQASGDRGMSSPDNEAYATALKVKRVILPQSGHKSAERRAHEHQPWFRRGRRFHAGVEGRISLLKRQYRLDRCLDHGPKGFARWVGWGVIAANLDIIGRALAQR
jgi:IS5 family transposase